MHIKESKARRKVRRKRMGDYHRPVLNRLRNPPSRAQKVITRPGGEIINDVGDLSLQSRRQVEIAMLRSQLQRKRRIK